MRELQAKGVTPVEEPKMKLVYVKSFTNTNRVAEDGETPNVEIKMGLGKPASPNLYDNILE